MKTPGRPRTDPIKLSPISTSSSKKGWPSGVLACTVGACLVFLVNLVVTIWAIAKHGISADGRQLLFDGDCDNAGKINLGIHLTINILSTVLLGSSNCCMQCLCAPTRTAIDLAHANGDRLDVGVSSFRNLGCIRKRRAILWWLLGLSSLSLHLFYNSAVFSTITGYKSRTFFVDPGFLTTAKATDNLIRSLQVLANHPTSTQVLNMSDCISAYAKDRLTSRGDVVIVLDVQNATSNTSVIAEPYGTLMEPPQFNFEYLKCAGDPYGWSEIISIILNIAQTNQSQQYAGRKEKTSADAIRSIGLLAPISIATYPARIGFKQFNRVLVAGGLILAILFEHWTRVKLTTSTKL